jgi:hypothetical protein
MPNPYAKHYANYRVSWKQNECGTCKACDHKRLADHIYTYAFHSPEPAMELAITILKNGHTLLFVEQ